MNACQPVLATLGTGFLSLNGNDHGPGVSRACSAGTSCVEKSMDGDSVTDSHERVDLPQLCDCEMHVMIK